MIKIYRFQNPNDKVQSQRTKDEGRKTKRYFKILTIFLFVVSLSLINSASQNRENFALAEDFPRGTLVYLQIADLPQFIKMWNESKLKENYLESENFAEFQNHHLALKIASRWEEFNEAIGFPLDLSAVGSFAENKAAVALYDIGKIEFVFVAPLSGELFSATHFGQNKDNFAQNTLADGTTIYSAEVKADRGRQKQKIVFAETNGRFVLATNESLLLRTLANIKSHSPKDRLSDEPDFKVLSEKITPHVATVWVNQTALNDDYYFRHYWLMKNADKLKNIRAGIFDLEIADEKLTENREFLLNETKSISAFTQQNVAENLSFVPEKAPYFHLQKANLSETANLLEASIFERRKKIEDDSARYYSSYYRGDDFSFGEESHDYSSLSSDFNETINDVSDTEIEQNADAQTAGNFQSQLEKILSSAQPQSVLTVIRPQVESAPLFAEFNSASIANLSQPENLNHLSFENAIVKELKSRLLVTDEKTSLIWETKTEQGKEWRELQIPNLGWNISYGWRGKNLILANNADFLREIMLAENSSETLGKNNFSDLTVINLNQRETAFDQIMNKLAQGEAKAASKKDISTDFFAGNIISLLDVAAEVKQIRIERNYEKNFLHEQLTFEIAETEEETK